MLARISNYVQDFRVPCNFMRDIRFMRMFRSYGSEGALAILRLWDWVTEQYPTTGRLEKATHEDISLICGISSDSNEFIAAMIRSGALDQDDSATYYLPNWIEDQPYAAEAEKRSEQARKNSHKRWGTRATTKSQQDLRSSNATALQSECSNTNSKAFKSPPTPPRGKERKVPLNEIAQLYADVLPELPQPNELTTKIHRDIEARWNANPERQCLEWWRKFFARVRDYPFLMGENGTWCANLGWLVSRGCMDKVLGGEYPTRAEAERLANGRANVRAAESYTLEEFEQMQAQAGAEPIIG